MTVCSGGLFNPGVEMAGDRSSDFAQQNLKHEPKYR